MRTDFQADADILALDSGKWIVSATAGCGVGACLERDVLPHQYFCVLIIQGQQARGRKQVVPRIAGQG
ncbi:hypothetical protein D3C76_1835170 [compost metagenome]